MGTKRRSRARRRCTCQQPVVPGISGPGLGNLATIERVTGHLEKHVGPIHQVFHERESNLVHIDVYHVRPAPGRHFHTLVISGMSDRPMSVPGGSGELQRAELVVLPIPVAVLARRLLE